MCYQTKHKHQPLIMRRTFILLPVLLCLVWGKTTNLPSLENEKFLNFYEKLILEERTFEGNLDLVSYNAWALPIELKGHDHDSRFNMIGDSLLSRANDIICLQEAFHPVFRQKLMEDLKRKYYTFSDYRCNETIVPFIKKDCYGGLMTFSVYPIVHESFYKYPIHNDMSIIEKIGSKGFLWSIVKFGNRYINIINTHLYAGDKPHAEKMRQIQLTYMQKIIAAEPKFEQCPTILMGDFNVHHPDVEVSAAYKYIMDEMEFTDSKPCLNNTDFTFDPPTNHYTSNDNKATKLDYIFYKFPKDKGPVIISQSRIFDSKQPLSDHYGWKVFMKI